MGVTDILLRLVLGLVIGFCIGLTGVGGGVLVLPALMLMLKMDPIIAVGTANLYAFPCRIVATAHHWKHKTIAFRVSGFILVGAVPANIVVALLVNGYTRKTKDSNPEALAQFQDNLGIFIAGVVIVSAVLVIHGVLRKRALRRMREAAEAEEREEHTDFEEHPPPQRIGLAIALGALVGALIAASSVGGGVLIVPMLVLLFGLSAVETVGSSVFIAVGLTFISSIIYLIGGQLDVWTAVIMAAGSIASVPFGVKLSKRLPDELLQSIVGILILIAGALMICKCAAH